MAVNVENPSTGISRTQAMRGHVEDAVALGIGVKESIKKKPAEAAATFLVATAIATGAATGGHVEKVVTAPAGLIEDLGAAAEPAVSSAIDFVKSDPELEAEYAGRTSANNELPEAPPLTIPQGGPISPAETTAVYDGVHTYDSDPGTQVLPTAPPEPAFAEGIADNSQSASPAETGGAAPGEISGGSPIQP